MYRPISMIQYEKDLLDLIATSNIENYASIALYTIDNWKN